MTEGLVVLISDFLVMAINLFLGVLVLIDATSEIDILWGMMALLVAALFGFTFVKRLRRVL